MIRSGSEERFVCSWRRERGPAACDNGRGAKGTDIADHVLAASGIACCRPTSSPRPWRRRASRWRNAIGKSEAGAASWKATWPKPSAGRTA
ncbi:hypothetical protein [Brevundimonas sp.]|uniref:hypothetical protein n=1 Tax=Brevundimonas sp. TaxID=1871086 RepID=UPI00391720C0